MDRRNTQGHLSISDGNTLFLASQNVKLIPYEVLFIIWECKKKKKKIEMHLQAFLNRFVRMYEWASFIILVFKLSLNLDTNIVVISNGKLSFVPAHIYQGNTLV